MKINIAQNRFKELDEQTQKKKVKERLEIPPENKNRQNEFIGII